MPRKEPISTSGGCWWVSNEQPNVNYFWATEATTILCRNECSQISLLCEEGVPKIKAKFLLISLYVVWPDKRPHTTRPSVPFLGTKVMVMRE